MLSFSLELNTLQPTIREKVITIIKYRIITSFAIKVINLEVTNGIWYSPGPLQ